MHYLTIGKYLDSLKKLSEKQAVPMLDNAPELYAHLYFVWDVWCKVDRHRQGSGNGPQPLALSEIISAVRLWGVTSSDETDEIVGLIEHLDGVYLKWAFEKLKQQHGR